MPPLRSAETRALGAALRATIPVMMGYVPLGMAFGLVLVDAGLPWWLSPAMAIIVFAGAAQFMGVGLISAGAGVLEIGVLTLLLNARHAVYGLSLLERFKRTGRWKPYLVFGLTDETYGLLTTIEAPKDVEPGRFYGFVTLLDQSYWVAGCLLGAALGAALPLDTSGLDFALTALFVVLLVEQLRVVRRPEPYLAAAAGAGLALLGRPRDFLVVAILAGIGLLLLARRRLERAPGAAGGAGGEGTAR